MSERFYGKYRGQVTSILDPLRIGRIMASVPDVAKGVPTAWAMPCVPITGVHVIPRIGSGVWIEYEQGDPDYPIWSGTFWGSAADVPTMANAGNPVSPSIILETQAKNMIVVSDIPGPTGGLQLKTASGAMILINDVGITITNGKGATIQLTGPSVNVNNGALTVM